MTMKRSSRALTLATLLLLSLAASASGQRSEFIDTQKLEHYPRISLEAEGPPSPMLHYMGTASLGEGRVHLLMITRTYVPRHDDGSLGMPWDSVHGYLVDADQLAIINGWSLDERLEGEGIHLRPSFCPRIPLSNEVRRYELPADEQVKRDCLEMRYSGR